MENDSSSERQTQHGTPDPEVPQAHSHARFKSSLFRRKFSIAALTAVFTIALSALLAERSQPEKAPAEYLDPKPIYNEYYERGREFYQRHRPEDNDQAIEIFRDGLSDQPDHPLLMSGLAEAYLQQYDAYGLGSDWLNMGYDLAMQAVELAPDVSATQHAAGLAEAIKGDRSKAQSHYQQALEINPGNRQAMGGLAYLYLVDRDIIAAWPLFKRGLELDRSSPRAHMFIAMAYNEAGAWTEAEPWFEEAWQRGQSEPADQLDYMFALAYHGQATKALELLQTANEQMTPQARLKAKAYILALSGDYQQAADDYTALFQDLAQNPGLGAGEVDEAASRWISLGTRIFDEYEVSGLVEKSIENLLESGPQPGQRVDIQHEVALRLLALRRWDEGLQWLEHAIGQGWINYPFTLAEPAVQSAIATVPGRITPILEDLESRQMESREVLLASPPER